MEGDGSLDRFVGLIQFEEADINCLLFRLAERSNHGLRSGSSRSGRPNNIGFSVKEGAAVLSDFSWGCSNLSC